MISKNNASCVFEELLHQLRILEMIWLYPTCKMIMSFLFVCLFDDLFLTVTFSTCQADNFSSLCHSFSSATFVSDNVIAWAIAIDFNRRLSRLNDLKLRLFFFSMIQYDFPILIVFQKIWPIYSFEDFSLIYSFEDFSLSMKN